MHNNNNKTMLIKRLTPKSLSAIQTTNLTIQFTVKHKIQNTKLYKNNLQLRIQIYVNKVINHQKQA